MKGPIKRILIICSGNTARSPAAEYLAKNYAKKLGMDLEIDSAGLFNAFTYMQPESREYLDEKGINHSDFRPKTLSKRLLENQDLIITMERYHVNQIENNFSEIPRILDRTFTIKEFNGDSGDIIDPYYTNRSTYVKVMKELDAQVEKMIKKVAKINSV